MPGMLVCCWLCEQVGYPLVTALVCLVDEDTFGKLVDSMADFFVKQMKVKENRCEVCQTPVPVGRCVLR